jgi:hypothetical protein
MSKFIKAAVVFVFLFSLVPSIQAEDLSGTAEVKAVSNPADIEETQRMLREVAVEKGIPAEILKAIAFVETNMRQFEDDGTPVETGDGGIGIMQLTLTPEEISKYKINVERLRTDKRYNIEKGAEHLLRKWDSDILPLVNNHEKDKIEDWYFAVMAYNGLSKRNDPKYDESIGKPAYQEDVFHWIRENSQLSIGETPELDIRYKENDLMFFPEGVHYQWPTSTKTTQNYKVNEIAYTYHEFEGIETSNLRESIANRDGAGLPHYTPVHIVSGPYETEPSNIYNHYVFYEVEGYNFKGFIASSNLITSADVSFFKDIPNREQLRAVTFLQTRKTINGFLDGTYRPERELLRHEAAKLIVQALDLELPEGYEMKATDTKPGYPSYEYMKIVEAHGIMGQGGKMYPGDPLTRSQMASILVRAFADYFEDPPASYQYGGEPAYHPNYRDINKLAYNEITNVPIFKGNDIVDRGMYAVFLERSLKLKESQS